MFFISSTFKQFARTFSSSVHEKRILSWLIFLLYVRIIVHADVCSKMVKSFSSHYTCSCLIAGKPWPVHTYGMASLLKLSSAHVSQGTAPFLQLYFTERDILPRRIIDSSAIKHWFVHELIEIPHWTRCLIQRRRKGWFPECRIHFSWRFLFLIRQVNCCLLTDGSGWKLCGF